MDQSRRGLQLKREVGGLRCRRSCILDEAMVVLVKTGYLSLLYKYLVLFINTLLVFPFPTMSYVRHGKMT